MQAAFLFIAGRKADQMTDITRKQFLDFVNIADDITTKVNGNFTVSYYDDFTQKDFDALENKLLSIMRNIATIQLQINAFRTHNTRID